MTETADTGVASASSSSLPPRTHTGTSSMVAEREGGKARGRPIPRASLARCRPARSGLGDGNESEVSSPDVAAAGGPARATKLSFPRRLDPAKPLCRRDPFAAGRAPGSSLARSLRTSSAGMPAAIAASAMSAAEESASLSCRIVRVDVSGTKHTQSACAQLPSMQGRQACTEKRGRATLLPDARLAPDVKNAHRASPAARDAASLDVSEPSSVDRANIGDAFFAAALRLDAEDDGGADPAGDAAVAEVE